MKLEKLEVWCEKCGCVMKLRKGKRGWFYGCTGYPICKNTMSEMMGAIKGDKKKEKGL